MKLRKFVWSIPVLCLTLSGCGIGGHWMEGISGQAREDYLKSIKPYIAYWQKEGMTVEGRRDWMACGGHPDGGFRLDRNKRLPSESSDEFRTRLEFEFQRCMLRSGYRYTGDCSSEYMKARPLCGAP